MTLSLFGIAYLAFCVVTAWPKFSRITEKARSAAAANTIATIGKECAAKVADTGSVTVVIPELQGYTFVLDQSLTVF